MVQRRAEHKDQQLVRKRLHEWNQHKHWAYIFVCRDLVQDSAGGVYFNIKSLVISHHYQTHAKLN